MKSYSSREIIRILERSGWVLKAVDGDHHQFIHAERKGKVTVQHPVKDLPAWIVKSIERQSGLKF